MPSIYWREPLWLLLAFYPLVFWFWKSWRQKQQAAVYADPELLPWVQVNHGIAKLLHSRFIWQFVLWILVAIALAGPRTEKVSDFSQQPDLDVLVILDTSRSMQVDDIEPNRIQRAALELHEWLPMAKNSRIGMIVYAAKPHHYIPLTADQNALKFYFKHLDKLVLPTQGSRANLALNMARQQLQNRPQPQLPAAILWLSDGDIAQEGQTAIEQSIQKLQSDKIPLYILGIGTEDGDAIPLANGSWLQQNGQVVRSRLNSALLQRYAELGNGKFSLVQPDTQDWQILYQQGISQLAAKQESEDIQEWQEWYPIPLALAFLLMLWLWRKPTMASALGAFLAINALIQLPQPVFASDIDANLQAGINAYRSEDYTKAIAAFSRAVFSAQNDQERARAIYNLGNSYFQQGDYILAIQVFEDVLRYQKGHQSAKHNLGIAVAVQTEIERRLADKKKRDGQEEGWAFERQSNQLDWDTDVPFTMELYEGEIANFSSEKANILPDDSELQALVSKGLALLQQGDSTGTQSWRQRKQSIDTARMELQQIDGEPTALWKRLFEIEEGYPASLNEPDTLPEVQPW